MYDSNATCNAWKHNARRGENDQERQWPPFDPRYRRYINTGKMYTRGANEMFRVCTFVNASWHGCAPTIMYCLASGSGYREPVSAQVFGVLQCYSASFFSLSFFYYFPSLSLSFILFHFIYFFFLSFLFFVLLQDMCIFTFVLKPKHLRLKGRLSLIKSRKDSSRLLY